MKPMNICTARAEGSKFWRICHFAYFGVGLEGGLGRELLVDVDDDVDAVGGGGGGGSVAGAVLAVQDDGPEAVVGMVLYR